MSMVRRMFLVNSILATIAIAPATALGAANGTDLPVMGTIAGVASTDIATTPAVGTTQLSGQISQLGEVTATSDFLFTPLGGPPVIPFDLTGTATLVAANGDQLFGTYTGTGVNNAGGSTGSNLVTITGGTGRFTGATGTVTETYTADTTSLVGAILSGPITLTLQGRISY